MHHAYAMVVSKQRTTVVYTQSHDVAAGELGKGFSLIVGSGDRRKIWRNE